MTSASTTPTDSPSGARARNQRYRARHRRIDYVPSAEALAIITAWKERNLDNCMAGVLDKLLIAGDLALKAEHPISGNLRG